MGGACDILWGNEKCIQNIDWKTWVEGNQFRDLGVNRRILLKWFLKKVLYMWTGFSWVRIMFDGSLYEHCNELSSFIRTAKFPDQQNNMYLNRSCITSATESLVKYWRNQKLQPGTQALLAPPLPMMNVKATNRGTLLYGRTSHSCCDVWISS
jgi:hypothetical protein